MLNDFSCAPHLNPVGFGQINVGPFFFMSAEIILDFLFLGRLTGFGLDTSSQAVCSETHEGAVSQLGFLV